MMDAVLYGIVGGLGWALTGFVANKTKPDEEFDTKKFLKTVIIGAVVGAVSGYTGQDIELVATSTYTYFVTAVVDKIVNAIWRLFK